MTSTPQTEPATLSTDPLRCLGKRAFALLSQRWRTLQHIAVSPGKITQVAKAALVLLHYEHGYLK